MFQAMILACVVNADGSISYDMCMGFTSPYIWPTMEYCVAALNTGVTAIEEQGWTIQDLECYDWRQKKGTKL